MLTLYEWASIKILKEKGHGIKEISRLLKMSKNTVRKALRSDSFKEYSGDNKDDVLKSRSNVSAYHEKILEMLIKDKFIGSRIFIEIRKLGYSGSKTAFYDYLRRLKGQVNILKD